MVGEGDLPVTQSFLFKNLCEVGELANPRILQNGTKPSLATRQRAK